MGRRKPPTDEPFHSFPLNAIVLASPAQSAMPEVGHRVTKMGHSMPRLPCTPEPLAGINPFRCF
jgi:hypothetical protein